MILTTTDRPVRPSRVRAPIIVTATNRKIYSDSELYQQPNETLDMLQDMAQELGATAVISVRLTPMLDQNGHWMMMAYGTATFD